MTSWNILFLVTLQPKIQIHYEFSMFGRIKTKLYHFLNLIQTSLCSLEVGLLPASKRIFQSLLLKLELMRFQKMSAPFDSERAWRSCGTASEASWQNSDFNMDHRLKDRPHIRPDLWELLISCTCDYKHTWGWAFSPGRRTETEGDPCERGTDILHAGRGSSGSSACWTRYQAPQTWTFP